MAVGPGAALAPCPDGTAVGAGPSGRGESRTRQSETAAEVVGRLRATFNTGVTRGLDWRVNQLQRLRALLVENEQELIEALWADLRKNPAEAKTQEIDFTVADIDETLASLESWL
ncbi:hypothetical protein [Actinoplanes sp. ATCC 53533]|uniref:hypothetical protein n=1 Tax=Actinoplanes sp. ATCC 53533 TaxID=1288362 RepID=UPI001F232858|nr:hypothetical protein [Actinoplanes sp. ATCC 53533]